MCRASPPPQLETTKSGRHLLDVLFVENFEPSAHDLLRLRPHVRDAAETAETSPLTARFHPARRCVCTPVQPARATRPALTDAAVIPDKSCRSHSRPRNSKSIRDPLWSRGNPGDSAPGPRERAPVPVEAPHTLAKNWCATLADPACKTRLLFGGIVYEADGGRGGRALLTDASGARALAPHPSSIPSRRPPPKSASKSSTGSSSTVGDG